MGCAGSMQSEGGDRMSDEKRTLVVGQARQLFGAASRREFLRAIALGGTAVLLPTLFAGCDDDQRTVIGVDEDPNRTGIVTLDLSTDVGILNYAFALEQMEAAQAGDGVLRGR